MRFNFLINENGTIDAYLFEYRGLEVTIKAPCGKLTSGAIKSVLAERLNQLRGKYSALSSLTWPSESELTEITASCFVLIGGKTSWESPDNKIDQVIHRIDRRNRKLKCSSFFADLAVRLLNVPQNPACKVHSLLLNKSLTEKQRDLLLQVYTLLSGRHPKLLKIEYIKDAETVFDQLLQITTTPFQESLRRGSDTGISDHKQNRIALAKPLAWAAYVDLMYQQSDWNARHKIEDLKPSISFISMLSHCRKSKDIRRYYSGIASPEPPTPEELKKIQNAARQRAFRERRKSVA
jgi:hypothetical protein